MQEERERHCGSGQRMEGRLLSGLSALSRQGKISTLVTASSEENRPCTVCQGGLEFCEIE